MHAIVWPRPSHRCRAHRVAAGLAGGPSCSKRLRRKLRLGRRPLFRVLCPATNAVDAEITRVRSQRNVQKGRTPKPFDFGIVDVRLRENQEASIA